MWHGIFVLRMCCECSFEINSLYFIVQMPCSLPLCSLPLCICLAGSAVIGLKVKFTAIGAGTIGARPLADGRAIVIGASTKTKLSKLWSTPAKTWTVPPGL